MKKDDLDKLIKIARTPPKKFSKKDTQLNEAERFVYELGLQNGDDQLKAEEIYQRYLDWKDEKEETTSIQKKSPFFRDFSKLFEKKRTNSYKYYLLDKATLYEEEKEVET